MIIGITGVPNSGKDTVAAILKEWLALKGRPVVVTSFAEEMRAVAQHMGYDLSRVVKEATQYVADFDSLLYLAIRDCIAASEQEKAELYGRVLEAVGHQPALSPREFLQALGQAGRKVEYDFWTRRIDRMWSADLPTVVSDVRYPGEASMCDVLIAVVRPGTAAVNGHESERAYSILQRHSQLVIQNVRGLSELKNDVIVAAQYLIAKGIV